MRNRSTHGVSALSIKGFFVPVRFESIMQLHPVNWDHSANIFSKLTGAAQATRCDAATKGSQPHTFGCVILQYLQTAARISPLAEGKPSTSVHIAPFFRNAPPPTTPSFVTPANTHLKKRSPQDRTTIPLTTTTTIPNVQNNVNNT